MDVIVVYPDGVVGTWYGIEPELDEVYAASHPKDRKAIKYYHIPIYKWIIVEMTEDKSKVWVEKVK